MLPLGGAPFSPLILTGTAVTLAASVFYAWLKVRGRLDARRDYESTGKEEEEPSGARVPAGAVTPSGTNAAPPVSWQAWWKSLF